MKKRRHSFWWNIRQFFRWRKTLSGPKALKGWKVAAAANMIKANSHRNRDWLQ